MVRFLIGLMLGGLTGAIAISAAAILYPTPDGPIRTAPPFVIEPVARNEQPAEEPRSAPASVPEAAPEPVPAPEPEAAPEPTTAPAVVETPAPTPESALVAEPTPEPEPASEPEPVVVEAPVEPQVVEAPVVAGAGPEISQGGGFAAPDALEAGGSGFGTEVNPVEDRTPVRTASVPQPVTSASQNASAPTVDTESAAVPDVDVAAVGVETDELVPGDALSDNAVPFDGDLSRPLMSIILIDEGSDAKLREGLTEINAPITFGVSANLPDASAVAAQYSAAGFEVIAVMPGDGPLGLTESLAPDSVAPLLGSVFRNNPKATAVMDPIDGILPKNRRLTDSVLEALKVTGHGLLTYRGTGFNSVPLIADEAGVYSEVIYRVIDEEPGASNVTSSLERAVLDAARGGSVLVVGRVRQETVSALFSWLLSSGPRDVTIAPVSAALR